jgi:hypothetical protein
MRIARSLFIACSLLLSLHVVIADEDPHTNGGLRAPKQHFVFTPSHSLTADEQAQLRAAGIEFDGNLTNGRYLVSASSIDASQIEDRGLGTAEVITPSQKIYRAARRAAAAGGLNAHLTLMFHDDVTFDEARKAVAAAGGVIESPLTTGFGTVKMLTVRMPGSSLEAIAGDDRVKSVAGPSRHPVADNAIAAVVSNVTPLFSAPYGLTGSGVVLSLFELGRPDTAHVEFGGRLTTHLTDGSVDSHSTHVAGTMSASGVNPAAKGMAPGAQAVHLYDANVDASQLFNDKQVTVPATGSVADNNSWGFQLGWQSGSRPVWYGCFECLGGYDGQYDTTFDKIARTSTTLYIHSAGNDGFSGNPDLVSSDFSAHSHVDDNTGDVISSETFCYSKDGSGTDCPAAICTAGSSSRSTDDNGNPLPHCEKVKHPTYGPFTTLGLVAGAKNVVAVGALDVTKSGFIAGIASFSSRGPTRDGRVKPDVVAKGTNQYSSVPNNFYAYNQGTSMSSPVVTGISALLVEQWRKTFPGKSPTPQQLKTLLIAGADDMGNPGPDFTMGYGLVDAKASVDLIIADAAAGNRIRNGTISQGQTAEYSLTLPAAQSNLRVVLGWADPEVFDIGENDLAGKTLVNDLDVSVIGPSSATTLPYVLDAANPTTNATRGVNTVDNTEEVEIANAAAGTYRVVVKATKIGDTKKSTQDFVLIANAPVGTAAPICSDSFSAYNSTVNAFGDVPNGASYSSKFCAQTAADFFKYNVTAAGTVRVSVTAGDTALTVTELNATGAVLQTTTVAAGQTGTLTKVYSTNPNAREFISITPATTLGSNPSYTVTFTYPFTTPVRRRSAHH